MEIKGKTVLVLGGWGLVGSAVCRRLIPEKPEKIIVSSLLKSEAMDAVTQLRNEYPDVDAIPFFNTIPPIVINPATDAPVIVNGSPVPLLVMRHDANGNLYAGQANPLYDKILLPALSLELEGVGIPTALGGKGTPLPDSLVLDSAEVSKVQAAITGYNSVIQSVATANPTRVALVNAYSVFNNFAANGYTDPATGVHLTDSYITGGFFGLDGIHPTDQGYGYVANMFIKAINTTFGANT